MPLTPNKVTTRMNIMGMHDPVIFNSDHLYAMCQLLLQVGAKAHDDNLGCAQFALMVPQELLNAPNLTNNMLKVEDYPVAGAVYPTLGEKDYLPHFSQEENETFTREWNETQAGKEMPIPTKLPNEVGSLGNFRIFKEPEGSPISYGEISVEHITPMIEIRRYLREK